MQVSCVFQEPRLLLWKTVAQNIAFVLQDFVEPARQQELIKEYLTMMGLYDYRDSYPKALSGGMKQRLALCRAFAYPHDLLLMDEPFKSLDTPLRLGLVRQVARMWQTTPRTIVFVTHDIIDALLLGHRVIVLSARPAAVLDEVKIDVPLMSRNVVQEPLPAAHARMLALLEVENKKYFPNL
jgi:NitT/TauT family transport system ATP-binding protein